MSQSCDSVGRVLGSHVQIEKKKNQVCLSTHVDDVVPSRLLTRRGGFVVFLPSVRSVLVVGQSLFVCLCTFHVSVVSRLRVCSQLILSDSFLSSARRAEHICILTGQIVTRVQRSVIRIVNCWTSEQFSRVRKSSRVRVHQRHRYIKKIHIIKKWSGASVTVYGMSGTEGQEPAGTD